MKAVAKVAVKAPAVKSAARSPAKPAPAKPAPVGIARKPLPPTPPPTKARSPLADKEKARLRELLLAYRQRLAGQIHALTNDSLKREDEVNSIEDGTDAFDRQFALGLASSEQQSVAEIDEALTRLSDGTYGACDSCGCAIERARLEALPFVRTCIRCQAALEKNNGRRRMLPGFGAQG